MKRIIFFTIFLDCVLSSVITALIVFNISQAQADRQAMVLLRTINSGMNFSGNAFLESMRTAYCRVLHVSENGEILFDNRYDVKNTDAKNKKIRYSSFNRSDGTQIRAAVPPGKFFAGRRSVVAVAAFVLSAMIIVSMFLAKKITKKITRQINEIDLENPLNCVIFGELSPLMRRIKKKNNDVAHQFDKLRKRKSQFEVIAANMVEGLIILDVFDKILFCNKRAVRILDSENRAVDEVVNHNVLVLCRNENFRNGIKFPPQTTKLETSFEIYKRTIKMIANQITDGDKKIGATILLIDITEQADREKLRHEFSANVSHELKTPLTVISGYAEMLAGGIVKGNDVADFSKKIHAESQYLLSLINDIIELSNLDENIDFEFEEADLYEFAQSAVLRIKENADKKNISIELKLTGDGKETKIKAVPRLLDEILFNILDNATKYNRKNGKILVEIKPRTKSVIISVTDTGLGIPRSQQSRVFERFYRADSSRTGRQNGTGLGLSIVKNAVQIHGGKVSIASVEGEWTRVSVKFPLAQ